MHDLPDTPIDIEKELDQLAERYAGASNIGIEVLNLIGAQADGLVERLPAHVQSRLERATEMALKQAMKVANGSRYLAKEPSGWMKRSVATVMGAAGGFGGMTTALAELPVTTTLLLRVIQDEAKAQGFDPAAENIQFDCVQVFAAAGPLAHDDGADLAFLTARFALTSGGVQRMAAVVAPRLAGVLGQKLAAQAVPVIGAVAGAATNYAYLNYYREMAYIHFALRRLAIEADTSHPELIEAFRARVAVPARNLNAG